MLFLKNTVKIFLLASFLYLTSVIVYVQNEEFIYNLLYTHELIDDSFPKPIKDYDDHLATC